MMKLQSLQQSVERDEYEVDPRKVADAIVARLRAAHEPSGEAK